MRSLKLETIGGTVELADIVEYAFGFKFLFVKTKTDILAIDRSTINEACRKYKDRWIKVNMKNPKKRESIRNED